MADNTSVLEETIASVKRMQDFDVNVLSREQELGDKLNFLEVVQPAQKLVNLFKRLTLEALKDIPENLLSNVKNHADSTFNLFDQVLNFQIEQQNPVGARQTLIKQISSIYDKVFSGIHPFISYATSVSTDFQRVEHEARAKIQSVKDKATQIVNELEKNRELSQTVLEEIRNVAAEQGVSQQAIYFREESETHARDSESWRKITVKLSIGLGVYAISSLFIHKIPWISPETTYQSVQLVTSKVLIFGVISYMLFLSARNFLSHKHNAIVNKHRQNALVTFQALVEAASDEESKDVILAYAASCIFSPQDTGYSKSGRSSSSGKSLIEILPKVLSKSE